MQNAASMNSDIKALLALLLLKSGTNAKDIQTALQLAAASRVMVAEENAEAADEDGLDEDFASNISDLRVSSRDQADHTRGKRVPSQDVMNSDIKALLTLLLLRSGTSSVEIQTTLRFAAASRVMIIEELAEPQAAEDEPEVVEAPKPAKVRNFSPRQPLRAEHLAPIAVREFAA